MITLIRQEKSNVISAQIIDTGKDTKKLYKIVGEITNKNNDNPLPDNIPDETLVEDFADFFLNKIKKIRDSLDDYPLYEPKRKEILELLSVFNKVKKM